MHGGSGLGKLACVMIDGLEGASPAAMASSTKRMTFELRRQLQPCMEAAALGSSPV